jgi:HAMP domain-containing protein
MSPSLRLLVVVATQELGLFVYSLPLEQQLSPTEGLKHKVSYTQERYPVPQLASQE